jgi:hypothetical protein
MLQVRVLPGARTISVPESEQTTATATTVTVDATLKARIAELARQVAWLGGPSPP